MAIAPEVSNYSRAIPRKPTQQEQKQFSLGKKKCKAHLKKASCSVRISTLQDVYFRSEKSEARSGGGIVLVTPSGWNPGLWLRRA
jgi:hypothetical protein